MNGKEDIGDMPEPRSPVKKRFGAAEYDRLPEGERWELIEGDLFVMVPAPGSLHQEIAVELTRQFANHLLGKPGKVYAAPYEVRFPEPGPAEGPADFTIVLPDLAVVCDPARRTPRGCLGVPDLIVEILSPGSLSHDQVRKLNLYERHGVREYWILHPEGTLMVFLLGPGGRYGRPQTYEAGQRVPVSVLEGLVIDLATVFPPRPSVVREPPIHYRTTQD